ncbi:uncharacterized protein LOC141637829 [Silene latifolia]|uniref:uncharacterized protein LOC141637829 n=1 Tax=Silene latifolia TaxID=37657 RepID=UPI003D770964
MEWVEAVLRELSEEETVRFVMGVWAVWEVRNGVVFEGRDVQLRRVVARVRELLKEMEEVEVAAVEQRTRREQGERGTRPGEVRGWQKPSHGLVKINVDAGVKEGDEMGIGVVCRDENGTVQWGWAKRRREEFTARVAEAEAVLVGLQLAKRMKVRDICVEGDCKELIEALQHGHTGRSDFHVVIEEINLFCRNFNSVFWSFSSRNFNLIAHELAHFCKVGGSLFFDDSTIPSRIVDLGAADLNGRM